MTLLQDGAALLGRLLLAVIFLLSGFQKLVGFGGTVALMGEEGLPFPLGAAIIAILVECVGGIGLVIGYQTRLTGTVLAMWCVATAFVAHADFSNTDQMIHFLKNISMAGGLLYVIVHGSGPISMDAKKSPG